MWRSGCAHGGRGLVDICSVAHTVPAPPQVTHRPARTDSQSGFVDWAEIPVSAERGCVWPASVSVSSHLSQLGSVAFISYSVRQAGQSRA